MSESSRTGPYSRTGPQRTGPYTRTGPYSHTGPQRFWTKPVGDVRASRTGPQRFRTKPVGDVRAYRLAGEYMRAGLLAGNGDVGWTALLTDGAHVFRTRSEALRALSGCGSRSTYHRSVPHFPTPVSAPVCGTAPALAPGQTLVMEKTPAQTSVQTPIKASGQILDLAKTLVLGNAPVPVLVRPSRDDGSDGDDDGDDDDDAAVDDDDYRRNTMSSRDPRSSRAWYYRDSDEDSDSCGDDDGSDDFDYAVNDKGCGYGGIVRISCTDHKTTHCGCCSDRGPLVMNIQTRETNVPIADLPLWFVERHFNRALTCIDPDCCGGYSAFWGDLYGLVWRNTHRAFSSELWNVLARYVDEDGNMTKIDLGGCECLRERERDHSALDDPRVVEADSDSDADYKTVYHHPVKRF